MTTGEAAVTEKPYDAARLADLEGPSGWSPIRRSLGVRAFGINAWTAHEAHEPIILEHDERSSRHEELYLVTAGRATFTVDNEQIDAPAGTIIFVRDPNATRGAEAREPDTIILSVGGKPGEAFRPRAWETNLDVLQLFDDGRYRQAKALLTDALERYDDRSTIFYNLACAEAQLGETDAALQHLSAAVIERPSLATDAHLDSDLAPIRDDPRFAALVPSS
jgi:tetratricopeptide (TPR) repeat protein